MIKLENVVLASPEQMEFIIEGMRNPMNSWEKSDSWIGCKNGDKCEECYNLPYDPCGMEWENLYIGEDILIERNYYERFKVVFKNYLDHDWRRLICFYMVGNAIGSQLL